MRGKIANLVRYIRGEQASKIPADELADQILSAVIEEIKGMETHYREGVHPTVGTLWAVEDFRQAIIERLEAVK